ncbi:siderophore-interacting protein [Citricoccus sp. NR2]|uniref:siderophore-interacting protein n=1 Tax=Citricoccus sp. NR2 TaxID=3004095 RepID=UPI0022DD50BB|nr:siderophore-interacting protein [Citricoccus sp. NR2]WBL20421.1 siderophore-interacting protein [Citricoccus sp. NR2]
MTTSNNSYPSTRAYRVQVAARQSLSEHFVRFTFSGDEVQHFGTDRLDQRIKLLFPLADGSYTDIGMFSDPRPTMMQWYQAWRLLEEDQRNPMRTYTVRQVRPEQAEVDVDVVLHGTEGPASAWASTAQIGDEIVIVGPDSRADTTNGGIDFKPGEATDLLLAGDETAAPAILSILTQLAEREQAEPGLRYTGHALIEVPSDTDVMDAEVTVPSGMALTWLGRNGAGHGEKLTAAAKQTAAEFYRDADARASVGANSASAGQDTELVEDENILLWESPDAGSAQRYAWLAGEAGVITGLRRHLVKELGVDRKTIAFMGYWRHGRAEGA